MRTLTAAQTALLSGSIKKHAINIYLLDTDSTWRNLSNLEGFDFVQNVQISTNIDNPVTTANITLITKMFHFSLCPEIANKINTDSSGSASALIRLNAQIKITTATVAEGVTPVTADWNNIFQGYITKIDMGANGKTLQLECRDLGAQLQDTFIIDEAEYGNSSDVAEEIMQDILDANGLSAVTVYAPTSSDFAIRPYIQQQEPVMEALNAIALQAGYNIRYKWDDGTSAWRLTFYEPDRTNTTPDFTFDPGVYCAIPNYSYDIYSIRNLISVVFNSIGSSGTATAAAAGQLDDTAQSWAFNEFLNDSIVITGGTGVGQERTIYYNTATVLGITPNWTVTPNTCSTYKIVSRRKEISYPENGIASAGTTEKLTDSSKGWYNGQWNGYDLYLYAGTGAGDSYSINASSYTTITPATTWETVPDNTTRYAIVNSNDTGDGLYLYGPRRMRITEAAGSQIDIKAEARAMARAIYNDLSRFNKAISVEVDYFYPVQLGDLLTFEANDVIFDSDIDLAVVGITHNLGADISGNQKNSTVLELRGQPSGGYLSWFLREGALGIAPNPRFPATPSNLSTSTGQDIAGTTSWVKCEWDYNSELDLERYEIRFQTGSAEWSYVSIPAIYNTVKIAALKTSTNYDFQIRAVNKAGKASDWSSSVTQATAA